ncbi:unnamed protein product [Phytophthora lilii]|uniref:pectinesterase n=1 Tax=Phytophthora lilii TaxID=2077276 RepID=A0A9W6X4C5_9STRA|nr:unnamed protein product [Phytophthora lilii]
MQTFVLPVAVLATLATSTLAAVCSGPHARTEPPAGAIVVDGTRAYNGSFRTVAEAVASVTNDTAEHTIFVLPGIYNEQVYVPQLNGPLVIQGYTCNTTSYADNQVTITQARAQANIPPEITDGRNYLTTTLGLKSSSGVKVYNLNVANTAGQFDRNGQAVAVYVDDTDYGFYGCNFTGY